MASSPGTSDYFSGTKKGEPRLAPVAQQNGNHRRWWTFRASQCAQAIGDTVDFLQKAQSARIRQQVINQSLYGNRRLNSVQSAARMRLLSQQSMRRQALITDNVVQAVVDTAVSKIGETKPRPYFLTSGGNYKQQRKAKRLNKYIEGVFYEAKTYDLTPLAFRDACIDGDGLIHVFVRGGKIVHEVVSGMELWVDEEEAQYGRPRTLFRSKVVDRDELAAGCSNPKDRDAILRASRATDASRSQTTSDMVSVVEAWHLGSLNAKGDRVGGRHAFVLLGGEPRVLESEEPDEWPHDFFPFAKLGWCPPPTGCGYWSQSLAEQLSGDQIEMNKELQLVQQSMHMAGTLKMLIPVGSKIVKEHVNNEIGTGIYYAGANKPDFFCPEPIHPSFFENPMRIRERMFTRAGYSELTVAGKKPTGIDSGRGLRELDDQQSDRHKFSQRQYDAFHLQLAEITIALSIEAAENGELEAVRVPGKMSFDSINFKADLKGLKRSEFTLQCYSVSRLPRDPAGRLETIQEYIQAGIFSLRRGRKLLDFPDIEAEETLADAQENILTKTLDDIVDEGEYAPPEPTDDLALAKEMVLEYIQHHRATDLEEERMDDLRNWSMQLDELMSKAIAPPPMAGPAGMGEPQAAPMAAPQSELLPNAPGAGMAAAA